ncbi:MAG: methionine--tRNA ligase [Patescibacteria group bacterium]|nr:methionine--tRNA ligase [Patescibacteria group bacterium]
MAKEKNNFFITTAIDYVNGEPHLGHALEKIQADAIARYFRLSGKDVFFLTGADENSLKNVRAAEKEGIAVEDFVDKNTKKFKSLKDFLDLSFNDFIRTTEERHIKGAQKLWQECAKKGDICKGIYEGLYCVGCEAYLTPEELKNGCCPEHQTPPEQIKEENYFFRLSQYQKQIQEIIENDKLKIIPQTRKNEILSFVKSGLKDICVSRSNGRAKNWGISVPDDDTQKIWCWFDALGNYITALGYGGNSEKFEKYWQKGEVLHCIGKGISRFHAVYWLGILLSAGLRLPDKIFVHGYITVDGQKMSKSLGNVINPFELVEKYAQKIGNKEATVDAVRYYLLAAILSTEDGDFTYEKFEEKYNADLAKGIGNLVARVLTLATKLKSENENLKFTSRNSKLEEIKSKYNKAFEEFDFYGALGAIWELIGWCDKIIDTEKPWENRGNSKEVIGDLLLVLTEIAELLKPFLPRTSEKISEQIKTGQGEPLFPRI